MGQLKEHISIQKLRGGYYTPREIAEFLCEWSIDKNTNRLLEPSCGDGVFIEAAIRRFQTLGIRDEQLEGRIVGVELLKSEWLKSKMKLLNYGLNADAIINKDFFHYITSRDLGKFDVVIGNPPFIRYQNFPEENRDIAFNIMRMMNFNPNKLMNIWVPFLVISASLLKENGRMSMVIPAELFQVKYAAETRMFLSNFFERITIITFKKLVFDDIQQEVVLLLCEKKVENNRGIRVIECTNIDELSKIDFSKINGCKIKSIDHSSEKWTKYFLDDKEINLLRSLKQDKRIITCGNIMHVDVGFVTGRNQFFMLNAEQVDNWCLNDFVIPVVGRSAQLKGVKFNKLDFTENSHQQKNIFLFVPPNEDFSKLPIECQRYIEYGESKHYNTGYKTRIRKRWYITPSLWVPDAFALRQINDYPKFILNQSGASSTDTIHRIKFKVGINGKMAVISFINSLTFAFSEVTGRSYGGGVLTFEPSEIEELCIPSLTELFLEFEQIDKLIRKRRIEEALDIIDYLLLIKYHGFSKDEVASLRNIWKKLQQRRINRKNRSNKQNKQQLKIEI